MGMTVQQCPMCNKPHEYQPASAVRIQTKTPQRIARLLQGLTPAEIKKRFEPGKWSIAEVLQHLADCEIVYGFRTRLILAEEKPRLTPFDQELWAQNLSYAEHDPRLALQVFSCVRRRNVATMRRMKPADWDRTGDHLEYGLISYRQVIYHLTDHDEGHLAQIARLRGYLKPTKSGRSPLTN